MELCFHRSLVDGSIFVLIEADESFSGSRWNFPWKRLRNNFGLLPWKLPSMYSLAPSSTSFHGGSRFASMYVDGSFHGSTLKNQIV